MFDTIQAYNDFFGKNFNAYQQLASRAGNPLDIANAVLHLCSDKA